MPFILYGMGGGKSRATMNVSNGYSSFPKSCLKNDPICSTDKVELDVIFLVV